MSDSDQSASKFTTSRKPRVLLKSCMFVVFSISLI